MEKRVQAIRQKMRETDTEALMVHSAFNRRYLSGFTGTSGIVLLVKEKAYFITDFRYIEQATKQAPHFQIVDGTNGMWKAVASILQENHVRALRFEQDYLTFAEYRLLQDLLRDIDLLPTSGWVEELRATKDPDELALIQKAAEIADRTFEEVLKELRPGISERQVAMSLEMKMREMGATSSSFEIIVASGKRSALPHGVASEKILEKGDFITLDFGAFYKGYCSDITRTVVLGKPNSQQQEIYDIVLEAGKRTLSALRAGMRGKEADAIARDYITEHGYGDAFGHSTGHGIGLEIHENPRLSKTSDDLLAPDMVVTVEPGIYLPEFGGVRIEDDVRITENGCEILTHSPKELISLD